MSRARQNKISAIEGATKNIKAFIGIIFCCSINNSYVSRLWKDSQVTMLQKTKKTGRKQKITEQFVLPIAMQSSVKLLFKISFWTTVKQTKSLDNNKVYTEQTHAQPIISLF